MLSSVPEAEQAWLDKYFSAPNGLTWHSLVSGAAPQDQIDAVTPWLERLSEAPSNSPLILPFYRGNQVAGWYATATTDQGQQALLSSLRAWFGASYLTVLRSETTANPSAAAMHERFGREVVSFTGPDTEAIAARLAMFAKLDRRRPRITRTGPRPVGLIRSDLESALLARNETTALRLIQELRDTGRLNEENLQFLDIRLKAGLGQWEQIALDHWAIRTLSDLPLPPQTLSDLVEALYRVFVDDIEGVGEPGQTLNAFKENILDRYPRLFASRHGVRTERVVKAFILNERLQQRPNAQVLASLIELFPPDQANWAAPYLDSGPSADAEMRAVPCATGGGAAAEAAPSAPFLVVEAAPFTPPLPPPIEEAAKQTAAVETIDEGQCAFDDGQFDRAFEIDLGLPLHPKSLIRLVTCAQFIGTAEARERLLTAYDAQSDLRSALSDSQIDRIEAVRAKARTAESESSASSPATGWLDWARRLATGYDLEQSALDALDHRATWETNALRMNSVHCAEFADLVGNLTDPAAVVARQALPLILSAFFPEDEPATPAAKPVAQVALLIIALSDSIARSDLETLSVVVSALLELGLSETEYQTTLQDLESVQRRVASYANLAWSLDICEALAIAPAPSSEADSARHGLFLNVLGQCQGFAHRLTAADLLPIEYLGKDYGVDQTALAGLRSALGETERADTSIDLTGKLIGIYTLTETAGARAKAALLALYPGSIVEVNSDKVSTPGLTNLAKIADIFVFAWRSSSHQAFFCVKAALDGRAPIYAAGKGTASIVNAVREAAI